MGNKEHTKVGAGVPVVGPVAGSQTHHTHCSLLKGKNILSLETLLRNEKGERDLQDGGGVRRGDHLPPHNHIKNTSTCGTTPTEHLLNAGRRPQTSQKARNSPHTWVGQKKKEKKRDKRIGTGPAPVGGSCEGGKVSTH